MQDPIKQIPIDLIMNHNFMVVGSHGSGKTGTMKSILENIIVPKTVRRSGDRRFCVIDTAGVWHGIKASPHGSSYPGIPAIVVGGNHADLPLYPDSGEVSSRLVTDARKNTVFDISNLSFKERYVWMKQFLMAIGESNPYPLNVLIDEIPLTVNEHLDDIPWHMMTKACGTGNISFGIVVDSMINLDRAIHTRMSAILVTKTVDSYEQQAILRWINLRLGTTNNLHRLLDGLKGLTTQEAWFVHPDSKVVSYITFPAIMTYDTSAGSRDKSPLHPPKVVDVSADITEVRPLMEKYIAEYEANDPKRLKEKIAELEERITQLQTNSSLPLILAPTESINQPQVEISQSSTSDSLDGATPVDNTETPEEDIEDANGPAEEISLSEEERSILGILVNLHPVEITYDQWAIYSLFRPRSRRFQAIVQKMMTARVVRVRNKLFRSTKYARLTVLKGSYPKWIPISEVIDGYRKIFGNEVSKIFDIVLKGGLDGCSFSDVIQDDSINSRNYLDRLIGYGLVSVSTFNENGRVVADPIFFPDLLRQPDRKR